MSRRVCVVTAARSDYGAAKWLMKALRDDPAFELRVVVTGSHLEEEFGSTWREIEQDGFAIDEKVPLEAASNELSGPRAMGHCLAGVGAAFERLAPHLVAVLGDRYELLPICTAATLAGFPLAHVSGGDITEGAMDDAIRHAVTKLSHLHFPATEAAAGVIRQLGEPPDRVFVVGELSLESFYRVDAIPREQLGRMFGLDPAQRWILLAYHPVTLGVPEAWLPPLERALSILETMAGTQVLMTYPNADPGGQAIREVLHRQCARDPAKFRIEKSLGHERFISFLKVAAAIVGNSSSGLLEAPSAKLPAINIGERQKGRVRGANVIDADGSMESIESAFRVMASETFRAGLAAMVNPYGDGMAARRIADVLRGIDLSGIRRKRFVRLAIEGGVVRRTA